MSGDHWEGEPAGRGVAIYKHGHRELLVGGATGGRSPNTLDKMPHIADLSEYGRFGGADPGLIAVGWLDAGHEYPKGPRTAEVDAMLGRLSTSWSPVKTCGSHRCELCTTSEPPTYASGIILVPWGKLIYIAPAMINHYLRDHQYAPPREFINAVLAGPVIGSRSYFQAIINSGRNQTVVECASIQLAELEERIRSHGQR